jgi:hypothetical protein
VNNYLILAGVFLLLIGLAHSYLGERYILIRLFRRSEIPVLFGDDSFTRQTIRFAWHLTTIAWWGFAAILFVTSGLLADIKTSISILYIIILVFLVSTLLSLVVTRGRHLSWIVFFIIIVLIILALT